MRITQKKRGIVTRKRTPIYLMQVEGNNRTEKNYLKAIGKDKKVRIVFTKGNYTDPINMAKNLLKEIEKEDLKNKNGDKAYCIFDTDIELSKQKQIDIAYQLLSKKTIAEIILSNPCFEYWFILHFSRENHAFNSNDEVMEALKKYIPEYEKNKNCYLLLQDKTEVAVKNAKAVEKTHRDLRARFKKDGVQS